MKFNWTIGYISAVVTVIVAIVFDVFRVPVEFWGVVLFVLFWLVFFWTYVIIDVVVSELWDIKI